MIRALNPYFMPDEMLDLIGEIIALEPYQD